MSHGRSTIAIYEYAPCSVAMLMVRVGHVRMQMTQPAVPVRVRVRLAGRVLRTVGMLMVGVVHVGMRVLQRLVRMFVLVMLAQVQPDADRHQNAGDQQGGRRGLAERGHGNDGAEKWRGRKVGGG